MKRRSKAVGEAVKPKSRKSKSLQPRNTQRAAGSFRRFLERVKKAHFPAEGDPTVEWLRPFMTPKKYRNGEGRIPQRRPCKRDVRGCDREVLGRGNGY